MTFVCFLGDTRSAGARGGGLIIFGTLLSLLFRVTCWCKRGVSLRVRFAAGFRACKIGCAFVMHGTSRTAMMGVLSITLCCCICILFFLTLCSSNALVGFKIFVMFAWRSLMSRRPFCVALAIAVDLANLSVSARKCWCGVRFGSWQCCGIVPCLGNEVHIGNDPSKVTGTIHLRRKRPTTLLCRHPHTPLLCIPGGRVGICSSHTVCRAFRTHMSVT